MKVTRKYTEQELVTLLKEKDSHAFSYLFDHYAAALNAIAKTFIHDEQLADSVLHDSFVKVWKQVENYDADRGRLFTWMASIVRNTAIDATRSKDWRNSKRNVALTDQNSEAAGEAGIQVDAIGLRKFVGNLREDYKMVIEMSYFDGMTQGEISRVTGTPLGTVKTRLRSALIELRSWIANK